MTRDYAAERYNRRTRAIERQAGALERIAAALTVTALADAANARATAVNGSHAWTHEKAAELMEQVADAAGRL